LENKVWSKFNGLRINLQIINPKIHSENEKKYFSKNEKIEIINTIIKELKEFDKNKYNPVIRYWNKLRDKKNFHHDLIESLKSYIAQLQDKNFDSEMEFSKLSEIMKLFGQSAINFRNAPHKDQINKIYKELYLKTAKYVPKELHFVWIGGPLGEIQKDYIKIWAELNPDYKINIWYDSNNLLEHETSKIIKNDKNILEVNLNKQQQADIIIERQNSYYEKYLRSNKKNTDQLRIDFLDDLEPNEILKTLLENKNKVKNDQINMKNDHDNINFRDINEEGKKWRLYNIYNQEMNLRMNLAAASDIARLEILNEFGGIYLDTDILPTVKHNKDILNTTKYRDFYNLIENDSQILRNINIAIYESILNNNQSLINSREMSEKHLNQLTSKLLKDPNLVEYKNLSNDIKIFYSEISKLKISEIFTSIGNFSVNEGLFRIAEQSNSIIASHKSTDQNALIQKAIMIVEENYEILNKIHKNTPGTSSVFNTAPEADKIYKTLMDYKVLDRTVANIVQSFTNYRYDGLIESMKSTIVLSGPSVYEEVLQNYYHDEFVNSKLKFRFGLSDKFNFNTEEDTKSSWTIQTDHSLGIVTIPGNC
jgi:mannosyltransferase OCH1-like enzyme